MDRNSVIGLLLIAGILIGWSLLRTPSKEELRQERKAEQTRQRPSKGQEAQDRSRDAAEEREKETEKRAAEEEKAANASESDSGTTAAQKADLDTGQLRDQYGIFSPAARERKERSYTIENEEIEVTLSNKGGRITSVRLKGYQSYDSTELRLFDKDSSEYGIRFNLAGRRYLTTNELYFAAQDSSFMVNGDDQRTIRFRTPTGQDGRYIEFAYTLKGNSYEVDHEVRVKGLGDKIRPDMELTWAYKNLSTEKTMDGQQRISTVCYKYQDGETDYLTQQGNSEFEPTASMEWISFKQRFFSAILISDRGLDNLRSRIKIEDLNSERYVSRYEAKVNLPMKSTEDGSYPMHFFFGPNKYHLLASYERSFENTMNLGWGIIGWINEYLIIPIFRLLEGNNLSYGIVILILTLIIKTLLFPLTYKSFLSGAKQRVLKPEIDALQAKYKDSQDQMKQQQEMMALYKKSGVNPMAGCLPMFIQLPILIAMYRFFPTSIELRQEAFLWAGDLSTYDNVLNLPFHIPFYGDHVSLFTLLMFGSTMIYTKLSSSQMGGGGSQQMPQMQVMMYIFPIFILFIFNSWPAGLSYYYFTANVISIFQMLIVKHWIIDDEKLKQKIEENKKKPQKEKKNSNFQKRLEEMAKQKGQKGK